MIDLAVVAHLCISCAILHGLGAAWNAIAGSFGGIGGVLSPAGPTASGGAGSSSGGPSSSGSSSSGSDGAPSRQSAGGTVPPPAYTGPGSSTITPTGPTTVIGPDGRTHYFDPNYPSGGPTVPKAAPGPKGGSGGGKGGSGGTKGTASGGRAPHR